VCGQVRVHEEIEDWLWDICVLLIQIGIVFLAKKTEKDAIVYLGPYYDKECVLVCLTVFLTRHSPFSPFVEPLHFLVFKQIERDVGKKYSKIKININIIVFVFI